MQFRYVNDEPAEPFDMFGFTWSHGAVHDVKDAGAIAKLSGNRFFEAVSQSEAAPVVPKNKGGRPRKVVEVEPIELYEAQVNDDQN